MWGWSWLKGGREKGLFLVVMLLAAPNPCHRVFIWENVSWDPAMCLSALLASLLAPDGWLCSFPRAVLLCCRAQPVWGQGCQGRGLLQGMALLPSRAALQELALFQVRSWVCSWV